MGGDDVEDERNRKEGGSNGRPVHTLATSRVASSALRTAFIRAVYPILIYWNDASLSYRHCTPV